MIIRQQMVVDRAENIQSVCIINVYSSQLSIFTMLNINWLIIGIRMEIDPIFEWKD